MKYVLFAVLAFELGMAPWLGLSGLLLALAPGYIALAAFVVVMGYRRWSGPAPLVALAVVSVAVLGLVSLSLHRWASVDVWSDYTVDAAVIFVLLHATFRLSYGDTAVRRLPVRRQVLLTVILIVSIVGLAVEDAAIPSWQQIAPNVPPFQPQGVLALAISALLLWLTAWSNDGNGEGRTGRGALDALLWSGPLFVLVLGATAVILPYLAPPSVELWLPLMAVVAVPAVTAATLWRRTGTAQSRRREPMSKRALALWTALYLSAFPLIVGILSGREDEAGRQLSQPIALGSLRLDGAAAALFVFAVNLGYLLFALALGALAVDRTGSWAWRTAKAHKGDIIRGLMSNLPLILVFAAFFLITAETWEVAVETEEGRDWEFWALVAALVVVSGGVLLLEALRSVREARDFTANGLAAALEKKPHEMGLTPLPPAVDGVLAQVAMQDSETVRLELKPLRWVNALLVIGVYQAIVVVPLIFVSVPAFWGLAEAAVPPGVAATWIGGDDPRALCGERPTSQPQDDYVVECGRALAGEPRLEDPWIRVALLLAAFAILERVVRLVTEPDQREAVFGAAKSALRLRFAVALLYDTQSTAAPPQRE